MYCAGKYLDGLSKITNIYGQYTRHLPNTSKMHYCFSYVLGMCHSWRRQNTLPHTDIKMADRKTTILYQMSRFSHLTVFHILQLVEAMCWICYGSAVVSCWGMQRSWVVYLCWVVFSALLRWKVGAAPYGLAQQCAPSCGSSQGKNKPCRRDWKITFYVQPGTAFWPLYIPCKKFDDCGFLGW
jgi:hypothetical protein